jgi:fermentation-respiration switch protein FrsA (DUF1100 family)
MIKAVIAVAAAGLIVSALPAAAQQVSASDSIVGSWSGPLETVGLTLIFNITRGSDGKLTSTLDSPDQGATGIPTGETTFADSVLRITVPVATASFQGRLRADGKIAGEWEQGGNSIGLVLTRRAPGAARRPQEPTQPLPYDVEEVTFPNAAAGIELAGTFTHPRGAGRHPAVVLISGSGPQDRDEALAGHRPFLVLADHLTRQGIAVLRYDDRGVGKSRGDFATATTPDFASDALAAVAWLKQRPGVDAEKIGLIGHSEGGIVAPLASTKSDDVAFIVLMAGPGVTGEEILYAQGKLIMMANGATESAADRNTATQRAMFAPIKSVRDTVAMRDSVRAALRTAIEAMSPAERAGSGITGDPAPIIEQQVRQITSPWFRWFLTHDPVPVLQQVTVPVLAVNGALDLQVPPDQNLPVIEAALKKAGNRDVTTRALPGLNHLFQTATTGSPTEYARIDETMSPVALQVISDWIRQRFVTAGSARAR